MAKRKEKTGEAAEEAVVAAANEDTIPELGAGDGDSEVSASRRAEFLGFMLANEEYALDILEIKEIIRVQNITVVPRTPGYLKGIINRNRSLSNLIGQSLAFN